MKMEWVFGMEHKGPPDQLTLHRVRRRPLYEQVIEAIADYIISNNINVGDTLPTEMEFTQMLGVGRNTVREALKTLQAMGIIESVQKKGMTLKGVDLDVLKPFLPFIMKTTPQDTILHEEARMWLETSLIPMIIKDAKEKDVKVLRDIVNTSKKYMAPVDYTYFIECDRRFHVQMSRCIKNPVICDIAGVINDYFFMMPSSARRMLELPFVQRVISEHERLIDCIESGNAQEMQITLTKHLSPSQN